MQWRLQIWYIFCHPLTSWTDCSGRDGNVVFRRSATSLPAKVQCSWINFRIKTKESKYVATGKKACPKTILLVSWLFFGLNLNTSQTCCGVTFVVEAQQIAITDPTTARSMNYSRSRLRHRFSNEKVDTVDWRFTIKCVLSTLMGIFEDLPPGIQIYFPTRGQKPSEKWPCTVLKHLPSLPTRHLEILVLFACFLCRSSRFICNPQLFFWETLDLLCWIDIHDHDFRCFDLRGGGGKAINPALFFLSPRNKRATSLLYRAQLKGTSQVAWIMVKIWAFPPVEGIYEAR